MSIFALKGFNQAQIFPLVIPYHCSVMTKYIGCTQKKFQGVKKDLSLKIFNIFEHKLIIENFIKIFLNTHKNFVWVHPNYMALVMQ